MRVFALILNSLWQAAAIAAVMWIVLRSMPRVNAATRYAVWWAVLLLVLLLPLATVIFPRHDSMPASVVATSTGAAVNPLLPEAVRPAIVTLHPRPSSKWPLLIMMIWSAVFLYSLVRIACSLLHLRTIKAQAKSSPKTLPLVGRHTRLLLSAELSSPMAVGFLKPAVILPESLVSDLEPAELDHVLLHESAHLARFDDWTNLAGRLLLGALALHPVALWILRQVEREREIACDEWVVARTGQALDYATSLARMCERRWSEEQMLATGMFGRHSRIVERIELLLRPGREFSSGVSIRRIGWSCAALLALWAGSSRAPQVLAFATQAKRPSFEVASIKPGDPNERRRGIGFRGNQFEVLNFPLKDVIGFAYGVRSDEIFGGPKWIDSDLFSIEAKPGAAMAPLPWDDPRYLQQLMIQSLLEDRFKLALHRETRIEPIYELVVAKGGPKLKESAGPDANGLFGMFSRGPNSGDLTATNVGIANLVDSLGRYLGRPVSDKTGLTGKYDFKLKYMPEPLQQVAGAPTPEAVPPADSNGPSIFTALQEQLGLKPNPQEDRSRFSSSITPKDLSQTNDAQHQRYADEIKSEKSLALIGNRRQSWKISSSVQDQPDLLRAKMPP